MEVSDQLQAPAALPQEEKTHSGGYVDSIAGLNAEEKRKTLTLPGVERRPSSQKVIALSTELSH
jgi:hypothetical protein